MYRAGKAGRLAEPCRNETMAAMELLTRWMGVLPGGPGRPLVTYYDVATGERTELSGTTTANWVAKTANLLVDELDAEPGTRIEIALPMHWLQTVWILATWAVGGTVTDHDGAVLVAGPDDLTRPSTARHRVASALRPFATPFPTPPVGHVDLGVALPGQPDDYIRFVEPAADQPAVDLAGLTLAYGDLAAAAAPSTERVLLTPAPGTAVAGDRLTRDVTATLGALLGGGSLVLVSNATPADLERLAGQEQALLT